MSREKRKRFVFDAVYGEGTLQQAVYEDTAPVVTSVLDGYNVCIFAYGQTGASMALSPSLVPAAMPTTGLDAAVSRPQL